MIPYIPKVQMHQDSPDDVQLLDKGDDLHCSLTFGT